MKRVLCSLMVMVVAVSVSAQEVKQELKIKKGDKAVVPERYMVQIKNLEPIKIQDEFGEERDVCRYNENSFTKRGAKVTVLGIDKDRVLVRYLTTGMWSSFDGSCPSGALFFISKEKFSKMTAEYHKIMAAEEEEKDLIRRLIDN